MSGTVCIIRNGDIRALDISPRQCVDWVEEAFSIKSEAQLPPKISVHPQGNDFFTSMPCLLPRQYGVFGMKVVHRISGAEPALGSDILLYDSQAGQLLALIDGDWITTMRTGAVAALAIKTLEQKSGNATYSFVGLGNTARATALCLLSMAGGKTVRFRLLRYKRQAEAFAERFASYGCAEFEIVDSVEEFVSGADVIVSCITDAQGLFCPDDSLYRPGVLLVPVHTRGFQNCDLFFDKIFGDDTGHVSGFRNFARFKAFDEFANVLAGKNPGRESDSERIIAYNIGLGLHDVVFAHKIYGMLKGRALPCFEQEKETRKFWL